MFNIYQNQERLKWVILVGALLIGLFTLVYNDIMVRHLAERELRQISLWAKSFEFIVNADNDEEINFVLEEIVFADKTIPVIRTDNDGEPIDWDNLDLPKNLKPKEEEAFLKREVVRMQEQYDPIVVDIGQNLKQYIYYDNSYPIVQLKYFSYVQLSGIAILAVLAWFVFSASRRSEQNRVWVGLAKETAHQLGTPISSLMAWIEYFKSDPNMDQSVLPEMTKDIQRLEMITARFSSIGSEPSLRDEDVEHCVNNIVDYLRKRISSKVAFRVTPKYGQELFAKLNVPLFEWVIENICKNAVDAMVGKGKLEIYLRNSKEGRYVVIDISDTGKGIPKNKVKDVFKPGYTTKKRGWGLGLTLVKRIVENYHNGKIYVLKSEVNVGTTFRIMIPK